MSDDPIVQDPLNEPFEPFADVPADVSVSDLADLLADPPPASDAFVEPAADIAVVPPPVEPVAPAPVEVAPIPPPAVTLEPEVPWDLDGDGIAQWDTDGDGAVDFVEMDQDRDGVVDHASIDLQFDGVMDHTGADVSGDGVVDTVEVLPPPPPPPNPALAVQLPGAEPVDGPEVLLSQPTNLPASVTGLLEMPAPGVIDVTPINPAGGLVNLNEPPSSENSSVFNFTGLPFGPPSFLPPGLTGTGSLADNSLVASLGMVERLLNATPQELLSAPMLPPRTPTLVDQLFAIADPQGKPFFGSTGVQLDPFVSIGGTGKLQALLAPIPGLTGSQSLGSLAQGLPGFFVAGQQPVGAFRNAIAAALQ